MRTGKELILATKPFAEEQPLRSWWSLGSTLVVLALLLALSCLSPLWYVYIPCSIFTGLVLVRLFVIFHDFMHGTIFKKSKFAKVFMYICGLLALSPPHIWKHSHDDHHKHNSRLFGPTLGTFPLMTVSEYAESNSSQRLMYRIIRHPLVIAFGYFTSFFWAMSLHNFLQKPKKNLMAGVAVLLHVALSVTLLLISVHAYVWGMLIPMTIAGALGTYLFYAQHNFPNVELRDDKDWDYVFAALNSSSYMKMGGLMRWLTANIGFHHVHHLNSKIPFYRLQEANKEIEELQNCKTTSLNPIEVVRCLRLKLWDASTGRMLTFHEAKASLAEANS